MRFLGFVEIAVLALASVVACEGNAGGSLASRASAMVSVAKAKRQITLGPGGISVGGITIGNGTISGADGRPIVGAPAAQQGQQPQQGQTPQQEGRPQQEGQLPQQEAYRPQLGAYKPGQEGQTPQQEGQIPQQETGRPQQEGQLPAQQEGQAPAEQQQQQPEPGRAGESAALRESEQFKDNIGIITDASGNAINSGGDLGITRGSDGSVSVGGEAGINVIG